MNRIARPRIGLGGWILGNPRSVRAVLGEVQVDGSAIRRAGERSEKLW
jgi:hypothetical protein